MAITISDTTPRVQYTATSGQTAFTVSFEFFANTDLKVYNASSLLTYAASPSDGTEYSVTGAGVTGGGTVTLGSGGATLNDVITIYRDMPISRATDFPTSGAFQIASLNDELDKLTAMVQQVETDAKYSPKFSEVTSTGFDLTFPELVANKVISVNSAGTALEAAQSITDVSTVATVVDEIALLGVAGVITDMGILGTADVVSDMNVLATADVVADMNTLASADFVSDLNTLATSDIVTDMNLLATSANVTAMGLLGVSGVVTNMGLLGTSAVVTDMGLLGTSAVVTDLDILATSANVTAMGLLGTSAVVTNMGLLGTSAVVADLDIVADNIAGVTSFADRYRVGSSNPASSLDEGDLFFNTTDNALKYYNGSGWASITAGIGSLADDTTPQLGGMLDVNGNHIGDGTLELLKFSETGSAINEFTIANAATGNGPTLSASSSSDSNVDINITPLGTGKTVISGSMNDSISTTGKALVMGF
tara:strand:- start:55 stop:1494 length:1440 start_codon:yes stop_codon:yes gene_type:complete